MPKWSSGGGASRCKWLGQWLVCYRPSAKSWSSVHSAALPARNQPLLSSAPRPRSQNAFKAAWNLQTKLAGVAHAWAQRMSRREHRRRDPRSYRVTRASVPRLAPAPATPKRAQRDHKNNAQASRKRSTSSPRSARARSSHSTRGTAPRPEATRSRSRRRKTHT